MSKKRLFSGLIGGGVTVALATVAGIKAKDKIDYNRKVAYYGQLNKYFSEHAPDHLKKSAYMPKWEDNQQWKKIHDREGGKIIGIPNKFTTYEAMRNNCYELLKKDKDLENCSSPSESWCTSSCVRFRS